MISGKHIILDMGHLQIYHKMTMQHPMGNGLVYYMDKRFPVEVGPFTDNSAALDHWKTVSNEIPKKYKKEGLDFIDTTPPNNIICVDFKMKRRIK